MPGRPDVSLIARQQRENIAYPVGETGIWGRYVTAQAPSPVSEAAGYGESAYYVQTVITGLFVPISFPEIAQAGGYYIQGDMKATILDEIPSENDTITWRSVNYRVLDAPLQQQILQRSAYRMTLRRGQPVGG